MPDFKTLTLSDFYSMPIIKRTNGTITPLVDYDKHGKEIGLAGFNADPDDTDLQIRESAFLHYQELMERINKINDKL